MWSAVGLACRRAALRYAKNLAALDFRYSAIGSDVRSGGATDAISGPLSTTFAGNYTQQISLLDALDPATMAQYSQQKTGEKYLIAPHFGE